MPEHPDPPQIAAITPNHATPGSVVVVSGSYFCQQPGTTEDPFACLNIGQVLFGQSASNTGQYTDTSIMADVSGATGLVQVVVSVAGRVSNGVTFTIE